MRGEDHRVRFDEPSPPGPWSVWSTLAFLFSVFVMIAMVSIAMFLMCESLQPQKLEHVPGETGVVP